MRGKQKRVGEGDRHAMNGRERERGIDYQKFFATCMRISCSKVSYRIFGRGGKK